MKIFTYEYFKALTCGIAALGMGYAFGWKNAIGIVCVLFINAMYNL